MERIDGTKSENTILRGLFRSAEVSYTVSDLSKALGPMIDLMFVSQFIGVEGVTVLGYVSPLIMLFEMTGTMLNSGARNKVSLLIIRRPIVCLSDDQIKGILKSNIKTIKEGAL